MVTGRSSPLWPWVALSLGLLGVVLGWLVWQSAAPASGPTKPTATESSNVQKNKVLARPTPVLPAGLAKSPGFAAAGSLLAEARSRIAAAPVEERAAMLKLLGEKLDALQGEDAVAAILEELASGRDTATELPFVPGEEGLASATTWRVFLLDRLGRLDPRAAAEYARQNVFPSSRSAEECAISLRNVWQSYPPLAAEQGRTEVSGLLGQMLARPEWRAAPADGLLEALDFLAQATDPAPHLAALDAWLAESRGAATAVAAQIAIERGMAQNGDAVLSALVQTAPYNNGGMSVPAMARADLRRPAQAQAVAEFLRRLPPDSPVAAGFFRAFPLHRFSVVPGLAGVPRVPNASDLRAADQAALGLVNQWADDPSLHNHREELLKLSTKLRELTGSE